MYKATLSIIGPAVLLLTFGANAMAQPAVAGASGTWTHKGTVTITGSGFGAKATAAPVVWDDASGVNITDKWDGAWPNNNPTYNTVYRSPQRGIGLPHNHVTKYIAGAHGQALGANAGYNVIFFKNRTIPSYPVYSYLSWYQRADDGWVFGQDNNFKTYAFSVGTTPYEMPNNYYLAYNTPYPDSRTSGASYIFGDDSNGVALQFPDAAGHTQWWDSAVNPMSGVWTKIEMEVKYTNLNDGYIKLWENGALRVSYVGHTDRLAGTARTEGIGGYGRMQNQPTNWRYFADAYLDYSRARVILGNAPTLAASTQREVQIPSAWSASSLTLSANLGAFADGATAYVYVFDSNGVANSSGFPVTIGSGGAPPPPPVDTTPPSVTATSPANNVTGVSATSTVTVAFSEPMTASTVTSSTVEVRDAANALVTAVVSYDAALNRAVVTHATPFVASSSYTVTVKGGASGVKDAAGNPLSNDYVWSFTTAAAAPAPIGQLVAAYAFSENAGTTVADLSGNNNVGTILNATWTASGKYGPGLSFNGTNAWVTASNAASLGLSNAMTLEAWVYPTALTGWKTVLMKETATGLAYSLYANDNSPWPATYVRITGATNSDAAGGTTALPVNAWTHLASTYDGTTLTLYVNGTAVTSRPVTGTITASTGPLHIGGNSIWGEYFTGVIDEVRVYSRALSAAEIQTDMAAPVTPPDTTPPTVTAATPAAGATGVSTGTTVTATFNEAMDASSITATSFELRTASSALVTGTVSYNAGTRVATLTPSAALTAAAAYTAKVKGGSGGVRDAAANALAADYTWSFTIAAPPPPVDTTPPTVSSVSPASGATGVSVAALALVTFSEAMDAATISTSTIELRTASNALVTASLNYDSVTKTATLTPSSVLLNGAVYTVTVKAGATGVKDAAGNPLAATFTSSFTTVSASSGALVASYAFNEGAGGSARDGSGNSNTGTISGATWTPAGKYGMGLEFNGTTDWVTVPNAATLGLTNAMTLEAWIYPKALSGWKTVVMKEMTGALSYALYANDNSPRPATYVRMTGATLSNGASGPSAAPLNTWTHLAATYDGVTLKLFVNGVEASSQPASGTISASTGPLHIGGNAIWGEYFTGVIDEVRVYSRALTAGDIQTDMATALAGGPIDTTPPTVTSALPGAGTRVGTKTTISATFSEPVQSATIGPSTIQLRDPSNTVVTATVSYDASTRTAKLTPAAPLAAGTVYRVTIAGGPSGIKDLASNPLAADVTWAFTAGYPLGPVNVRIVR
jgi:hypothetical protein